VTDPDVPPPASPEPAVDVAQAAQDTQFIVQSAQRNEQQAWTLLSAKILFFLRSRFGGVHLPSELEFDDFSSEVMVRILGEIQRFKDTGKGSFWGWVYILSQNRLNDLWRQHQRRQRLGLLGRGEPAPGEATGAARPGADLDAVSNPQQASPSELAQAGEIEAIERQCVAQLPASMGRIYLLRREQELPFEEISGLFGGTKPVTLRSYYKRARDFVKDCILRKVDRFGATFPGWQ